MVQAIKNLYSLSGQLDMMIFQQCTSNKVQVSVKCVICQRYNSKALKQTCSLSVKGE